MPAMPVSGSSRTTHRATIRLANGDTASGDVLIGADGVHSAIRQQMFGDGRAEFTGIMAWRGLVPIERVPEHQRRLVGNTWLGVGGHCVTYPLRRGEILNFVGLIERDDWRVESWTVAGTTEECLRDLAPWHEDIKTIVRNIDTPFKWALLGRQPLDHFAEGRVCVMGDAAHPTLPFLAQGANMALEDGVISPGASMHTTMCRRRCVITSRLGWSELRQSCVAPPITPNGSTTRPGRRGGCGRLCRAGVPSVEGRAALRLAVPI